MNGASPGRDGRGDAEIVLELYADLVCPWCYLGEARLGRALAEHDRSVRVLWRPFQLRPDMPVEGRPWRAFAEEKFGGWERARAAFAAVERAAAPDGLRFDFARVASAPSTADGHRLVLWAQRASGSGLPLARRLMRAYFAEGADLNDRSALAGLAAEVGLEPAAAAAFLAGDDLHAEVEASQRRAAQLGARAVPTLVAADVGVSGAQPVSTLRRFLEHVAPAGATPGDALAGTTSTETETTR